MYKALVIDDEKPVRQAIAALGRWAELGIARLFEAVEGGSGLAILREHRPEIVLVDMKMPRMDGAEFLDIASREYPWCKYIVISGYDDFDYARRAIKAKVLDYLLKPVSETELNEVLLQAISELRAEAGIAGNEELAPGASKPMAKESILYAIKQFIEENYRRDIKLDLFSERYFLSKEYLSKLFKQEFGYNIYEYVLKMRMEKARELLADPDIKVAAVSAYLGYRDNNYFSRAFKGYFGLSPTEYREELLRHQKPAVVRRDGNEKGPCTGL